MTESLTAARARAARGRALRGAAAGAARARVRSTCAARGCLIGVELESGAVALAAVRALLERGYLTLPAASDARVISLTPPLTIEEPLLAGFVDALGEVLA